MKIFTFVINVVSLVVIHMVCIICESVRIHLTNSSMYVDYFLEDCCFTAT